MQQRLGPTNYIINPLLGSTGTLEQAVLLESSDWRLQRRLEFQLSHCVWSWASH